LLRKAGFEPRQIRVPGEPGRRERRYFLSQVQDESVSSDGTRDNDAASNVPKSHVTGVTGRAYTHTDSGEKHRKSQIGNPGGTGGTCDRDPEREAIQQEAGA
jgi:hypothetical protein